MIVKKKGMVSEVFGSDAKETSFRKREQAWARSGIASLAAELFAGNAVAGLL